MSFVMAVRALVVLAAAPRGIATSAEIADEIGTHPVVVRRMLGRLRYSGLVESRPGRAGGWAIACDPATVTLRDVHALSASSSAQAPADSRLGRVLADADEAYAARLGQATLADLLRRPHDPPATAL